MDNIVLLHAESGSAFRPPIYGDSSARDSFMKYLVDNPHILLLSESPENNEEHPSVVARFGENVTIFKFITMRGPHAD